MKNTLIKKAQGMSRFALPFFLLLVLALPVLSDEEFINPFVMTDEDAPVPYVCWEYCGDSPNAAYPCWKTFDNDLGAIEGWTCTTFVTGDTLYLDLGSGNETAVSKYEVMFYPHATLYRPQNWTMEGSNNNDTWSVVDTVREVDFCANKCARNYSTDSNTTNYRYYKWNVTSVHGGVVAIIDEIRMFGETLVADLHIPIITNINLTSGNGGIGDNVSPYRTNDTTPTYTFKTDINANCSIGSSDQNYSTMGNTRLCAGGQGTTDHTCTAIAADKEIRALNRSFYLSCINLDAQGNQTAVSTSGRLETDIIDSPAITTVFIVETTIYTNETVEIGENFLIRMNYSGIDGIIKDGTCNISLPNGTTVWENDTTTTVCSTGCNTSQATMFIEGAETDLSIDDELHLEICHTNNINRDVVIDVQCSGHSFSDTIPAGSVTVCPIEFNYKENITVCKDSTGINISITNSAPTFQNGHTIHEIEYDRFFSVHNTEIEYNATDNLYYSPHIHEYYQSGIINLTASCVNQSGVNNISVSKLLTVGNAAPVIQHTAIQIGSVFHVFNDLVSVNISNTSSISFFENVFDLNLANHTTSIYNSSGFLVWNITTIGADDESNHTLSGSLFNNDTYNFTTIAIDDDNVRVNLTTRFIIGITENTAPIVTLSSEDLRSFTIGENVGVSFSVSDIDIILNCSLRTNESGFDVVSDIQSPSQGNNSLSHPFSTVGTYRYGVSCWDSYLEGFSTNHTVFITANPTLYNNTIIDNTNWFNTDLLNATTTAGVLMYFFILTILIGFIVLAEILKIPAFMFLVSILMFFYGLLIYTKISAIIGIIFYLSAAMYLLRSFLASTE